MDIYRIALPHPVQHLLQLQTIDGLTAGFLY